MKLSLPQGYISSSQISTWKYNKGQYIDKYIFRANPEPRPEMLYGKQFATWLEKGWDDAPPESRKILEAVKKYPVSEHKLTETFKTKQGEYDFLGFIDSYHPKNHAIIEYKTGRTVWDQNRVNEHLQTILYAGVLYKQSGVTPKVEIIWIPTHSVEGEIVPTGEVFTFKAVLTVNKILLALKEMERVALEIHEWHSDYQKTAAELADGVLIKA